MDQTVESFCNLIIRSRLVPASEVQSVHQRWRTEAKGSAHDLGRFAKWLVNHQLLTEYQAAALMRGHADHFFLDQYKLLDRIGKGRMAGVYKAVHTLGQIIAVKVLPPSKAKSGHDFARFQREARLAMRLKHPNVVRTFQIGEANGLNYIVMEYLEGETLDEVLQRRGKLPPAEAVRLVYQALLGLQHLYEQNMVHRDLKPANLMLVSGQPETTLKATVKILDIGLGRAFFDENSPTGGEDVQLTAEGAILGSPEYMAPEQARDAHASDIRADVYSLGCVLYHTLTGQTPFPDKNPLQQVVRHATQTPKPLRELNPAVPDGLQQIANWMMAKDPAKRYPTPERAAQALQVFLTAGQEMPKGLEAEPKMQPYLQWLEESLAGELPPAALAPPAKQAPVRLVPVASQPAPKPAAAPVRTPPARATAMARSPAPANVERLAPRAPSSGQSPPARSRDVFLLALGALTLLMFLAIGWIVYVLVSK